MEHDLTTHLYSSNGKHIANLSDGYLYNPTTGRNIGRYLDDKGIFVDPNGNYLGERFGDHRLLRKSKAYAGENFGAYPISQPIEPHEILQSFGDIGSIAGFDDIQIPDN